MGNTLQAHAKTVFDTIEGYKLSAIKATTRHTTHDTTTQHDNKMTTILPPVFICASWGDEMMVEEQMADAKFVKIARPEWEEEKRRAKTSKRFRSWNDWLAWASRVDDKRRAFRQPSPPPAVPSVLSQLLEARKEYIHTPAIHFYTVESQQREIKKVEKDILSCVGGADALRRAKMSDPVEEEEDKKSVASDDSDDIDLARFARMMVRA